MSSRAAKTEAFTLKPGWLNRQWLRIQAEAKTWPTWMKEESGGDRMAGYVSDYIKETEAWERGEARQQVGSGTGAGMARAGGRVYSGMDG
jgi:hypothetical protein